MNKILFLGILILFGVVFLYLMFNPPRAKKYNLKSRIKFLKLMK